MSSIPNIPDKDPDHPRWLLDIEKWAMFPYNEIRNKLGADGYGIVSYTWGMWADFNTPAPNPPKYCVNGEEKDLPWQIPTIKGLTLLHAREIMRKCLKPRFVWWDWMCVSQGKRNTVVTLPKELEIVKGEEIANQMKIYKDASEGFIWLHRTKWGDPKSLELQTYLESGFESRDDFQAVLGRFYSFFSDVQTQEPWLTSGWTLQEGVLLQESKLKDYDGNGLPGVNVPRDGQSSTDTDAAIERLAVPATGLADDVATAFMRYSEGWTPKSLDKMPQGVSEQMKQAIRHFGPSLPDGQHSSGYEQAAVLLTDLIRCGLVAYWPGQQTALYLLARSASRRFMVEEDRCWALIGALKLKGLLPWYIDSKKPDGEKKDDLVKIKKEFFMPLLQKYQWELFIVPKVEDQRYEAMTWPERIVHGGVLPLSLFFGRDPYETGLPELRYDAGRDQIVCSLSSASRNFVQLKGGVFVRHYRQKQLDPSDRDARRGIIEVDNIKCEERNRLVYLPIMDIYVPDASNLNLGEDWDRIEQGGKGLRCAEFKLVDGGEISGYFGGIVDLWGTPDAFEDISYEEFRVCASKAPA